MRRRVVAALALTAAVAIMAIDLIRMNVVAGQHLEALKIELDKVPPFAGAQRASVMRSRKSRTAIVGQEYVGPAPRPQIFDHYRTVFEGAGWRQCGHSIAHENYCRDQYEAIISLPSSLGPGSYSVTLEWNGITWLVWLGAGALIYIACWSLAELTRRDAPVHRRGWRSSLRLYTRLTPLECARQMETAGNREIVFRPGETNADSPITFTLERRQGRWTSSVMAPYFHGSLLAAPTTTGTTIVGSFGFQPAVRAGAATLVVIALLALGLALFGDGRDTVEWMLPPIAVGVAGLMLTRWRRRKDRGEITTFLTLTLQAEPVDSRESGG